MQHEYTVRNLRATVHAGEDPTIMVPETTSLYNMFANSTPHLESWVRISLGVITAVMISWFGAGKTGIVHAADDTVEVYFGQGCFWHTQHDLVQKEISDFGRSGLQITARTGYAGGKQEGKGGRVCYHNGSRAPDYAELGHAEVVNFSVPISKLRAVAASYFDDSVSNGPAGRPDPQDEGAEYRSVIGLPGGNNSPLFNDILKANGERMKLAVGQGDDPDTADTGVVWIYDSTKFPFHSAEVYHQFHDDIGRRYPKTYHDLKEPFVQKGKLQRIGCPEIDAAEEAQDERLDTFNLEGFGSLLGSVAPRGWLPSK